ncbi:MAG: hypothetical protein JWN44_6983 [Myxococcales bacterium]|nr:hypothetical protein [Myxococcales bacterium]
MNDIESNAKSAYEAAQELVAGLGKLGATWVRYGVSVAESTIQTSALTLEEAARNLRKVAERLNSR